MGASTAFMGSYFLGYFTYSIACKTGESTNSTAPCRIIVREVWDINLTTYKIKYCSGFLCRAGSIINKLSTDPSVCKVQGISATALTRCIYYPIFRWSPVHFFSSSVLLKKRMKLHTAALPVGACDHPIRACDLFPACTFREVICKEAKPLPQFPAFSTVLQAVGSYIPLLCLLIPLLPLKHLFTTSR